MNIGLIMAVFKSRQRVVEPITASRTWVAPAGVFLLNSLVGKGVDGTPYIPGDSGYVQTDKTTFYNSSGQEIGSNVAVHERVYGVGAPAGYCDPPTPPNGAGNYSITCHYFETFDESTPARTGANTTGFGKTFPGGVGVPATPATYNDVPVVQNSSYALNIPPGGSITITYFK